MLNISIVRFFCIVLSVLFPLTTSGQDIVVPLQNGTLWQMSPQTVLKDLLKNKSAKTFENRDKEVFIIFSSNYELPRNGVASNRFNTMDKQPMSCVTWAWKGVANHAEEWKKLCDDPRSAAACDQARLLWVSATLKKLKQGEKMTAADLNEIERYYAAVLEEVLREKGKRVINKDSATDRLVSLLWENDSCVVSLNILLQFAAGTKKAQREKVIERGSVELVIARNAEGMVAYNNQRDYVQPLLNGMRTPLQNSLLDGELWKMSPWDVYNNSLRNRVDSYSSGVLQSCTIDDDILSLLFPHTEFPSLKEVLNSYSHYLWFWSEAEPPDSDGEGSLPVTTTLRWAQAWNKGSGLTDQERQKLFEQYAHRRLKRISVILYQNSGDKKSTPPKPQDLVKCIDSFCSQKGELQPGKKDAVTRSIQSWRWAQEGKFAILLEVATLPAPSTKTDYVRLTFAPDVESLMYRRSARESLATAQQLAQNVQPETHLISSAFKPYKAIHFPMSIIIKNMNPGINEIKYDSRNLECRDYVDCDGAVLCYYGLCDIDNVSLSAQGLAVKQIKRIVLKSSKKAQSIYKEVTKMLENEQAFYKAKETDAMQFCRDVMQYIDRGIPIICRDYIYKGGPRSALEPQHSTKAPSSYQYVRRNTLKDSLVLQRPADVSVKKSPKQKPTRQQNHSSSHSSSYWCGYSCISSGSATQNNARNLDLRNELGIPDSAFCSWIDSGEVYVLLPRWEEKE